MTWSCQRRVWCHIGGVAEQRVSMVTVWSSLASLWREFPFDGLTAWRREKRTRVSQTGLRRDVQSWFSCHCNLLTHFMVSVLPNARIYRSGRVGTRHACIHTMLSVHLWKYSPTIEAISEWRFEFIIILGYFWIKRMILKLPWWHTFSISLSPNWTFQEKINGFMSAISLLWLMLAGDVVVVVVWWMVCS